MYEFETAQDRRWKAKYCDRWCYLGNGKPATQTTVTDNAPWSGAVPYINQGLQASQGLYNQGGPAYYPGQTYAGSNPSYDQGIASLTGIQNQFAPLLNTAQGDITQASNTGNSIANSSATNNPSNSFFQNLTNGSGADPGLSTLQDYASGKYLTADNPYFQQMSDTLKANVLPGINAQFANSGRGVSGLASRAASEGLGDSIGNLAYQNYQQGLTQQQAAANSLAGYGITGAQGLSTNYQNNITNQLAGANLGLNAAQLAPALQAMGINQGTAALLAGQAQQGLQQGQLDANKAAYDYTAQLPYQNLQNYISNISAQVGNKNTSTANQTSTPAQPSFWNQALQTGLTAASFFV